MNAIAFKNVSHRVDVIIVHNNSVSVIAIWCLGIMLTSRPQLSVKGKYLAGQSNDFVSLVLFQDVEDSLANVAGGSSDCNGDHYGKVRGEMEGNSRKSGKLTMYAN